MRVLIRTKPLAALAASATLAAACGGGGNVEGRYVGRGDTFFDSLTFGANGRAEVVLIGVTHPASYVFDGGAVTLTAPNGTESRFVVGADGCLTHEIVGTFCRDGNAPPSLGGVAPVPGGAEVYEATVAEGRITLELLTASQARMTMRPLVPGGDFQQLSFDVNYARDGADVIVSMPGDDPLRLLRNGRDFVATMDGETARFVRK